MHAGNPSAEEGRSLGMLASQSSTSVGTKPSDRLCLKQGVWHLGMIPKAVL